MGELERKREAIKESDFYTKLCEALLQPINTLSSGSAIRPRNVDCVCYGVGSPVRSATSQYQLMLLLLLREVFELAGSLYIFDPVMTELDKQVVKLLGFTDIERNERGLRPIKNPTLFYMPHCGHTLYSNVLRSNWTQAKLSGLMIIGNSFEAYSMIQLSSALERKAPYLCRSLQVLEELPFPHPFLTGDVFNNTSAHVFDVGKMGVEEGFWEVSLDMENEDAGDPEVV
ncbi:hypothetical protein SpCBS45565_g02266 [Spizellomyces sp. 'palustris']|nr:hypothetical protein SpCBS45565_g02266 [Spizellomyces sp. 'palustris']